MLKETSMTNIFQALAQLEERAETGALCTIIATQGSTPRNAGSKMLVYPEGRFVGTVGGGELEQRVIAEALAALDVGVPRKLSYQMNDPAQGDPGLCGGQLEVFIDPLIPKPKLVVIGGGHVGKAVVYLAAWLGFHVIVSDDRPEFCTPEAVPGAHAYVACPMTELAQQVALNAWTYIVLTTRSADVDAAGLPALLEREAAYIGVIGSRRRWATTKKLLSAAGVSDAQIDRIHSPIGLELNAETPEEIAVSILAQIIMQRRGGDGAVMSVK